MLITKSPSQCHKIEEILKKAPFLSILRQTIKIELDEKGCRLVGIDLSNYDVVVYNATTFLVV
jgi:hypothetical protein